VVHRLPIHFAQTPINHNDMSLFKFVQVKDLP